jgi:hypothetical protein
MHRSRPFAPHRQASASYCSGLRPIRQTTARHGNARGDAGPHAVRDGADNDGARNDGMSGENDSARGRVGRVPSGRRQGRKLACKYSSASAFKSPPVRPR